jgi:hypothetical protein
MTSKRTGIFTAIRVLVMTAAVLVGMAAAAHASPLTVSFAGSVNLSGTDTPFSGFFTWEPTTTPTDSGPNHAIYQVDTYQLIFNGVDKSVGSGGAGLAVYNDADVPGFGIVDAVLFLGGLDTNVTVGGVTGDTLLVAGFWGPTSAFNTLSLPTDFSFLSLLPNRFAGVSLEVPFQGDDNDVTIGTGSVTAAAPVPEPATLTLTALGLSGVVARARRRRQQREQ